MVSMIPAFGQGEISLHREDEIGCSKVWCDNARLYMYPAIKTLGKLLGTKVKPGQDMMAHCAAFRQTRNFSSVFGMLENVVIT
jgi:hypothetical protein